MSIGSEYDSLLAKVIAWGNDRSMAIQRLRRALHEYQIGGVSTDIDFLLQIIESAPFLRGDVTTTYLDSFRPASPSMPPELERQLAYAAALFADRQQKQTDHMAQSSPLNYWQMIAWKEQMRGE